MPQNQLNLAADSSNPLLLLTEATALFEQNNLAGALALINRLLDLDACPAGTLLLKSKCLDRANNPFEALQAVEAERILNPGHPGADEQFNLLDQRLNIPGSDVPGARPWTTSLDQRGIQHFENCSHKYTYRSVPMSKNAFDFALYPMLLWQIKPRTIFEIGSFYGGSAMWLGDMTKAWGLDTHVYSVDINKVRTARHDSVSFIQGNGRDLATVFSEEMLATLPRPWLVIEDADHSYVTTKAVLNYFHTRLQNGEYIIIEDVMTASPEAGRALQEFLAGHPMDYLVDKRYCDFFGTNVTWCVNGFLKRVNV